MLLATFGIRDFQHIPGLYRFEPVLPLYECAGIYQLGVPPPKHTVSLATVHARNPGGYNVYRTRRVQLSSVNKGFTIYCAKGAIMNNSICIGQYNH
jgi:hypothetical protein